ncbi:hypothetical protein V8E36_008261 [Tilletia maclaganii]
MLDVLIFHLAKLPFIPVNILLALRDGLFAPKGVSVLMRIVLMNMRLRFHKNLRSLSWTQSAVNRINARDSKLYCTSVPKPPAGVRAREITLSQQAHWSKTLAASNNPWKFFLIEPVRAFPSKRPFILYSHGGSFVKTLDPLHFKLLYDLCERTGATIFAHDYPRPPAGSSHEETYEVLIELLSSLIDQDKAFSKEILPTLSTDDHALLRAARDRTKLVFQGDSAGGGISLSLVFELLQRQLDHLLPEDAILLSPAMDGKLTDAEKHDSKDPWLAIAPCHTVIKAWAGPNTPLTHHLVSPAYASEELITRLLASKTRVLNFQGTADILLPGSLMFHNRVDGIVAKAGSDSNGKAKEKIRLITGVGMPHVWPLIPILTPEVRAARIAIVAAIHQD